MIVGDWVNLKFCWCGGNPQVTTKIFIFKEVSKMAYNNFGGSNAMSRKIVEKKRKERERAGISNTNQRTTSAKKDPVRAEGEEVRKMTAVVNVQPQEIGSAYKVKLMTQSEFEDDVHAIFAKIMPQYCGCTLTLEPNNQMKLVIYFEDRPDLVWPDNNSVIKAIRSIHEKDGNAKSSMDLIERTNFLQRNKQKVWELTQEGKDALAPFINQSPQFRKGDPKDRNYNWDNPNLSYNITERNYINGGFNEIVTYKLAVVLDINRLLTKMYGAKDDEGNRFFYAMYPLRPLSAYTYTDRNGHQIVSKYLIEIMQVNEQEVKDINQDVYMGMANNSGSLHISRPKDIR